MDKLGYMPKIDMEIGKVVEPWSFPAPVVKKKPTVQKATTRTKKPAAKKTKPKKV
jgi:hypothetical protein